MAKSRDGLLTDSSSEEAQPFLEKKHIVQTTLRDLETRELLNSYHEMPSGLLDDDQDSIEDDEIERILNSPRSNNSYAVETGIINVDEDNGMDDDAKVIEILPEIEVEPELIEVKENKSKYTRFLTWWNHEDNLFRILSSNQDDPNKNWKIKKITQVVRLGVNAGWPSIFYALLARDAGDYLINPALRYDNTMSQILLGTSHHTHSYTSHLGNELIHEDYFGFWLAGILSLPVFVTGLAYLMDSILRKSKIRDEKTLRNEFKNELKDDFKIEFKNEFKKKYQDEYDDKFKTEFKTLFKVKYQSRLKKKSPGIVQSISPWSNFRQLLSQATFEIVNNKNISYKTKQKMIDVMYKFSLNSNYTVRENNYFTRMYAKFALSQVIYSIEKEIQKNLSDGMGLFSENDFKEETSLINRGLEALKNENDLASKYALWSLGRHADMKSNLFWIPPVTSISTVLYAYTRYFELIVRETVKQINKSQEKMDCENKQGLYVVMPQTQQHECTVCGDWPFVYSGDVTSTQGCLSGLLQHEMNPDKMLDALDRLTSRSDFKAGLHFDLSQQDWAGWTDKQWMALLNKIKSNTKLAASFNLSRKHGMPDSISSNKTQTFGEFIGEVKVKNILLGNLDLGDARVQEILPSLNASQPVILDLSGNNLSADIVCKLSTELTSNSVETLILSNNLINDNAADCLMPTDKNSALRSLDVSGNKLGERLVDALANSTGSLIELNLAGNDLSEVDPDTLGKLVVNNQPLNKVSMSKANLNEEQVIAFSGYIKDSNLTQLDLSGNSLFDEGGLAVMEGVKNSKLEKIDLSNTNLSDQTVVAAADVLNQTKLQVLKLDSNEMTGEAVEYLFGSIQNSTLTEVSLNDCALDDKSANIISTKWTQSSSPVKSVSLSNNNLSDKGFCQLVSNLPAGLEVLDVSANDLGADSMACLADKLATSSLQVLDVSNNNIPASGMQSLSMGIQGSSLQSLHIDNNPVGNEGVSSFIEKLVTEVPNIELIKEVNPGKDFLRALDHSQPTTKINQLSVKGTGITTETARVICRVASQAGININEISMQDNDIDGSKVNIANCQFLESPQHEKLPNVSKRGFFSEEDQPASELGQAGAQALLVSAATSATALLFVEGLTAKGVSKEKAEYIALMLSGAISLYNGSALPMLTSLSIQLFCKNILGLGHETSLIAGNMASSLVHSSQELSVLNVGNAGLVVASSYIGSKCGYWLCKSGFWLANKVATACHSENKQTLTNKI